MEQNNLNDAFQRLNKQNSFQLTRTTSTNINLQSPEQNLYLNYDHDLATENDDDFFHRKKLQKDPSLSSSLSKVDTRAPLKNNTEKILAFVCICLLGFGSYFSYDSIAALQPHFLTDMKINTIQFILFNSISQWSNVIGSFLCGILIDYVFGLKRSGIIFASAALIGQIIFTISVSNNFYYTALFGRFILGLGTDSLLTLQNAYTIHFYDSKHINFLFGIQMTTLRMASVLSLNIQETVYQYFGKTFNINGYKLLGFTINISTIFALIATLCSFILYILYTKHQKRKIPKNLYLNFNFNHQTINNNHSSKIFSQSLIQEIFNNLISIDFKVWHIVAVLIFFYNGISPFLSLAVYFLKNKYNVTGGQAGSILSSIDVTSAICAPFIGMITDRFHNNVQISQIGLIIGIFGMILLNFTYLSPIFCIIMIGLAFSSISSSLWPYVNISVPEGQLGVVNGLVHSVQGFVLEIVVLGSGKVIESGGYFMFFILNITNLYLALALNAIFIQKNGKGIVKPKLSQDIDRKLTSYYKKNPIDCELFSDNTNSVKEKV